MGARVEAEKPVRKQLQVTQQEMVVRVILKWKVNRSASEQWGGGGPKPLSPEQGDWEGCSVEVGTMKIQSAGSSFRFGFPGTWLHQGVWTAY